ncbi:High frequency lysogenization protein HflD [hydrothermal vent metagenome]|uniref:High frequency lysogenization protein HflD n=1 Tax=hydrothermal vent metagenome TaxID=652676 RepID=A0A3B0XRL8_9ZZZZ
MQHTIEDRTLALAGVYQCVALVQQLARTGSIADAQLAPLLETLFRFDASNVMDIYGDANSLKKGLSTLKNQLSGKNEEGSMQITRYIVNLLHLETKLNKTPGMMQRLAQALEKTQSKMDYFDVSHENIIANLADIYQQDISPLGAKIMVQGEETYLSQQNNANKIRALLFAGIRSAVLWRQCGGGKLQLMFSRRKYIDCIDQLLKSI